MSRCLSSFLIPILIIGFSGQVMADNGEDFFQAIGKMYVVVAIILIIFLGLCLYLWRLDRKLSQLENKGKYEQEG
ncbi:MAG: CcmD family protein [Saprospiraceae bacterium]|nr:CcmD family protein [Saprospiraceae bacterium]